MQTNFGCFSIRIVSFWPDYPGMSNSLSALPSLRNQSEVHANSADDGTRPASLILTQIKCIRRAIELPFPDTF